MLLLLTAEAAAQTDRSPILGVLWNSSGTQIAKLDALTLQPVSARVRLAEPSWFVGRSPQGDRAVFSVGRMQERLRFVDLRRMRAGRAFRVAGVLTSLWRDSRRVVVVTGNEPAGIFVIDPVTRRVKRTASLEGSVVVRHVTANRLVLLLAPAERMGTARLAVVDASGRAREVTLDGVRAGMEIIDRSSYLVRQEIPGLAVDPGGHRAVVVPAVGALTQVDLDTLTVTNKRMLSAHRKLLDGWHRSATWFGHLIAVTGSDTTANTRREVGLTLIDTRDWTQRTLEPDAWATKVAGNTLLVLGAGVSGYTADGTKTFELLRNEQVEYVQVLGGYAYIASDNNTQYTIVDPAAGTIVKRVMTPTITTLAGG